MRIRVIPAACALLCATAVGACGSSSSSGSGSATATKSAATQTSASTATATSPAATQTTTTASSSAPQIGFEGVPLEQGPQLAPASTTGTSTVDGISCDKTEQLVYHIHAHLAVFDDGQAYVLPAGVGIPGSTAVDTSEGPIASGGSCIYWLHTHTTDGVIHIESPSKRIYTLGDFFDVWRQPLGPAAIASLTGKVTAFVNGSLWTRSPRAIPLLPHEDIQLEIGEPAPPIVTIDWSKTGL